MKTTKKERSTDISPEEAMKQIQKIFQQRGSKALEMARKEILKEKIECKEAREALTYFMTEYWNDLARPTLLSLACEAVGGDPELTAPIAVTMILISGAIDIHDDIIDKSKLKNERPTVYGKFGKDIALLVGDALLFKGLTLLNKSLKKGLSQEKMSLITRIIQKMFFELGDAEALELQLRKRIDILPETYLQIVRKKAADVEAHMYIGAIVGNASNREIQALSEYGRLLGMMIILRDDWIDIIDLKESQQRIKNECISLPILYALQDAHIGPKLSSILSDVTITSKEAQVIMELTLKARTVEQFKRLMQDLMNDALSRLEDLTHNTEYLQLLLQATLLPTKTTGN